MEALQSGWWISRTTGLGVCHGIVCVCMCKCSVTSHVRLFATLWTVARQAPLSMGVSRQGYWSGLPFPTAACVYTRYIIHTHVRISLCTLSFFFFFLSLTIGPFWTLLRCWWECKLVQPVWESMEVPPKTENITTIWLSNSTPRSTSRQKQKH